MLAVRCELLLGSYQAADPFGSADAVEWPPHPYRLHAALVAAACEAGGEHPAEDALAGLRWLEVQAPPAITCSLVPSRRTAAKSWVPRNPTRGGEWGRYLKAGSAVNRVARTFPTAVPEDPVVTFTWPGVEAAPDVLVGLIEAVAWFGSSRSPVMCAVEDVGPQPCVRAVRTRRMAGSRCGSRDHRGAYGGAIYASAARVGADRRLHGGGSPDQGGAEAGCRPVLGTVGATCARGDPGRCRCPC